MKDIKSIINFRINNFTIIYLDAENDFGVWVVIVEMILDHVEIKYIRKHVCKVLS